MISEDVAIQIGKLALWFTTPEEFEKYYDTSVIHWPIYRDFKSSDLLCSMAFKRKDTIGTKRVEGIHLNVMKNGDIFARYFPYYDGTLEVIPIFNQRNIFELAMSESKIKL